MERPGIHPGAGKVDQHDLRRRYKGDWPSAQKREYRSGLWTAAQTLPPEPLNQEETGADSYTGRRWTVISEKARQILSEEMSEDREQEVIFLEAADLSYIFRLFRAGDHAGDPEQRAIRWLDKVSTLCQSARGELITGLIRSRNEEAIMAAASGRAIEAREWPQEEQAVGRDPSGPVGRRYASARPGYGHKSATN